VSLLNDRGDGVCTQILVICQPDIGSGLCLHGDRLPYADFSPVSLAGRPSWQASGGTARSAAVWVWAGDGRSLVAAPARVLHLLKPYQCSQRLTAFTEPLPTRDKEGWPQLESKIAIGTRRKERKKEDGGELAQQRQTSNCFVLPDQPTTGTLLLRQPPSASGERRRSSSARASLLLYGLLIYRAVRVLGWPRTLVGIPDCSGS